MAVDDHVDVDGLGHPQDLLEPLQQPVSLGRCARHALPRFSVMGGNGLIMPPVALPHVRVI